MDQEQHLTTKLYKKNRKGTVDFPLATLSSTKKGSNELRLCVISFSAACKLFRQGIQEDWKVRSIMSS
ncbi:unnamed protein product [Linum trigynum]|uniref:Uncharacterized protein n=1 Tax=Linum trigynum TaxID=586398 RepID=A0AAV2GA67_9ROSI